MLAVEDNDATMRWVCLGVQFGWRWDVCSHHVAWDDEKISTVGGELGFPSQYCTRFVVLPELVLH